MSAKKDTLVNMGGVIGIKDPDSPLIPGIKANCISFEGFYTYGGLNGRDLECLAVGLYEGMDESYLTYRLGSIAYLGGRLDELGIPYQKPAGGHGIFLDAQSSIRRSRGTSSPVSPERGALQGVRHPCLRHWFLT
jgi:tryptophanase